MKGRLLRIFSRTRHDRQRELDEEIATHLELRAADLEAQGVPRAQAMEQARARFGDLSQARSELLAAGTRRDRRLSLAERVEDLQRDVLLSIRRMRARKLRTALLVGIFALGIGVTTAMFTVVDHVLLRPLPFPESHELVELQSVTEEGVAFSQVSMGNWYDWRSSAAISQTGIYRGFRAAVASDDEVVRVDATETGGGFFEALRPRMRLGRALTESDGAIGASVVVLSEAFWRQRLGGDPDVLGKALTLDGRALEVVGVLAAGYELPRGTALWTSRSVGARTGGSRNNVNFQSIARLGEGQSLQSARQALDAIAAGIRASDPEGVYSFGVGVVALREAVVGATATTLKVLMASVLLVLLVGCVNLTGLTLADGRERGEEMAVRLALGSGRHRLVRQLITEQIVLGLCGGALGLLLARWATQLAVLRLTDVLPRADEVALDARVALAALGLSLATGLLSGVAPAWTISAGSPAGLLSRTRVARGGRGLPGAGLVVVEIALTVVLLVGAGLLLRSLATLVERDLGFDATRVVTLDVSLATPRYLNDPDEVTAYWDRLTAALEGSAAAESVAVGTGIPTGGGGATFLSLPDDPQSEMGARYRVVSDGYFRTLGVPLLEGRAFGPDDTARSERVVVVNRAKAERYWEGQSAIGQSVAARSMESFWYGGSAPWLRVVGVVDDMRQFGFEDTLEPTMFVLYRQIPQMAFSPAAVVRVRPGNVAQQAEALQLAARAVDPDLAVESGLLELRVHDLLAERRLAAVIVLSLSTMALVLASLGIYGLLAFAVSARTPELAVRAAVGAGRRQLAGLVLRSAGAVVLLGAGLGAVGALAARGLIGSLLVDVDATDPATFAAVGLVVLTVSLAAVLGPALRAARMNPADALREG